MSAKERENKKNARKLVKQEQAKKKLVAKQRVKQERATQKEAKKKPCLLYTSRCVEETDFTLFRRESTLCDKML